MCAAVDGCKGVVGNTERFCSYSSGVGYWLTQLQHLYSLLSPVSCPPGCVCPQPPRSLHLTPHPTPRSACLVGFLMQFVRTLGRGSYGEVAQCEDLKEGGLVAIKRVLNVFNSEVSCMIAAVAVYHTYGWVYIYTSIFFGYTAVPVANHQASCVDEGLPRALVCACCRLAASETAFGRHVLWICCGVIECVGGWILRRAAVWWFSL